MQQNYFKSCSGNKTLLNSHSSKYSCFYGYLCWEFPIWNKHFSPLDSHCRKLSFITWNIWFLPNMELISCSQLRKLLQLHMNPQKLTNVPRSSKFYVSIRSHLFDIKSWHSMKAAMIYYCWKLWVKKY